MSRKRLIAGCLLGGITLGLAGLVGLGVGFGGGLVHSHNEVVSAHRSEHKLASTVVALDTLMSGDHLAQIDIGTYGSRITESAHIKNYEFTLDGMPAFANVYFSDTAPFYSLNSGDYMDLSVSVPSLGSSFTYTDTNFDGVADYISGNPLAPPLGYLLHDLVTEITMPDLDDMRGPSL